MSLDVTWLEGESDIGGGRDEVTKARRDEGEEKKLQNVLCKYLIWLMFLRYYICVAYVLSK